MVSKESPPASADQAPLGFQLLLKLCGHADSINEIVWSPNGAILASGSDDQTVRLWDIENGQLLHTLSGHRNDVMSVAWSPDGRTLASGDRYDIRFWDVESGRLLRPPLPEASGIYSIAWSPDNQTLASAAVNKDIYIWDMQNVRRRRVLKGHRDDVTSAAWSSDGRVLASGSSDRTVRLWDLQNSKPRQTFKGHDDVVWSVAWSPDGRMLASGSEDKTIRLWDTNTGREISVLESHTAPVMCVRFSPDDHLLASQSGDGTVRLWRCDTWEVTTILDAPTVSVIGGLAFHPHAPIMATRDEDNRGICIWRFDLVALLGSSPAVRSVRHVTGKIVLVGDAGVGKTGLGWRLAHGDFKEHPSTHGQQFWMLDTLFTHRADGTECEAVLWDLAGQPDYRLIHSLFLDDAELALVLFNPSERQEPLHGVDFWLKALSHRRGRPCRTILVGARMDRGDSSLTTEEIEAFWRDRCITGGYIGTSALTGHGLEELIERIREEILWDEMTATVTTATFKWIKQYVLGLKEGGVQEILVPPEALYQQLQRLDPDCEFDRKELMTAVEHLAKHG